VCLQHLSKVFDSWSSYCLLCTLVAILDLNLNINNEKQDCKIGTVEGVLVGEARVKEGD
jgi:hypothetical protein